MVENPYQSPATTITDPRVRPRPSCAPFLSAFAILALGALLMLGSFVYLVVFVGIPGPDLPPEIVAAQNFHFVFARSMAFAGLSIIVLGVVAFVAAGVWSVINPAKRAL